jgi:hypothetical protein
MTLRHAHTEGEAAPDDGGASALAPATARPVAVARLVDPAPSGGVGELVGARPLIQRTIQRATDGGPSRRSTSARPTDQAGPAVGLLAPTGAAVSAPVQGAVNAVPSSGAGAEAVISASPEPPSTMFALHPRRLPSVSAEAGPAVGAGRSIQRASAGPTFPAQLPLAPSRAPSQASIEATAMAVAQRAIDAHVPEPPPPAAEPPVPAVQRAVTIEDVTTSPGASGSSAGSSSLGHSSAELEVLATKLWGRLRLQLRRELLADRERAGMLTDLH